MSAVWVTMAMLCVIAAADAQTHPGFNGT